MDRSKSNDGHTIDVALVGWSSLGPRGEEWGGIVAIHIVE